MPSAAAVARVQNRTEEQRRRSAVVAEMTQRGGGKSRQQQDVWQEQTAAGRMSESRELA